MLVPHGTSTTPGGVVDTSSGGSSAGSSGSSGSAGQPWVFPFNKPLAPGEGDNQAMAVNTRDATIQYDVAFALVWVTDDSPALNRNEAYAFADCTGCAAVSVAFQVVLVTGDNHVAAPQNISAAVNYDCVNCLSYALATQLFVTLDGPLSEAGQQQIADLWAEIAQFGTHITEVPLSEIRSRLSSYEQQILAVIEKEQGPLTDRPTDSPTDQAGASPSDGGTAEAGATDAGSPTGQPTPGDTTSSSPSDTGGSADSTGTGSTGCGDRLDRLDRLDVGRHVRGLPGRRRPGQQRGAERRRRLERAEPRHRRRDAVAHDRSDRHSWWPVVVPPPAPRQHGRRVPVRAARQRSVHLRGRPDITAPRRSHRRETWPPQSGASSAPPREEPPCAPSSAGSTATPAGRSTRSRRWATGAAPSGSCWSRARWWSTRSRPPSRPA